MPEYEDHRFITPVNKAIHVIATDGYVDITPESLYLALHTFIDPDAHLEGDVTIRVSIEALGDYLNLLGVRRG